jgi:hypothetical protein
MNDSTVNGKVVFDLSQYELDDTATMIVTTPKGDEMIGEDGVNPITIEAWGPGTKQAVKAQHRAGQAAQRRIQDAWRQKVDPKAAEKADQERVDKACAMTKRINNLSISPEEFFGNPKLGYVLRAYEQWLDAEQNFFSKSPTS